MSSHRSLAGFLARLPVILGSFSGSISRAIWHLFHRIANLLAEIANWLWSTYCKIELSIVQVIVSPVLSILVLRQVWGVIAIAVVLAYFKHWIWLGVFVFVLAVAIYVYLREPHQDVDFAAAQQPLKDWLTSAFKLTLRAAIALASLVVLVIFGNFSVTRTALNEVAEKVTPSASSEAARSERSILRTFTVGSVVRSEEDSILKVLVVAQTESRVAIVNAAKQAGRGFDFSAHRVERNRKEARALNAAAKRDFQRNPVRAYQLQKRAMAADPLDVEVAGNLAIDAFRVGKSEEARQLALYALALPRAPEKTGRTADWMTLAAVYAKRGNAIQARNALFVTLAIAPDIAKRCHSAVQSMKNTYGDVLKEATIAMFERIRDQGLSNAPECALPIQW